MNAHTWHPHQKKILVIGGGIFGVTAAVRLAREGHQVDLYERYGDILQAASGINQYRLHKGHHYPRSADTTLSSLRTEAGFREEYREAIMDDIAQYYCVAKERSLVSGAAYVEFCKTYNLEFTHANLDIVNPDMVEACMQVKESLIDPEKLREICWKKLKAAGVRVHLGTSAGREDFKKYDSVVICAYASLNAVLGDFPGIQKNYQFELCEKPVVRLPKAFDKKSLVIVDGPFMCLDPMGRTGLFVMGNVVHAIHQSNVGAMPVFADTFKPLLNRGIVKNPPVTNFDLFISSAAEFIPAIAEAEHIGSMFTVRTVLPHQDATDSRPTVVEAIDDKIITVFSGKIGNCVEAAEKVCAMVR